MTYYIQITLWFLSTFHFKATPIQTIYSYSYGALVYVIPISYADSISPDLHNWVDSSRSYTVLQDTAKERINIVQLSSTDLK